MSFKENTFKNEKLQILERDKKIALMPTVLKTLKKWISSWNNLVHQN